MIQDKTQLVRDGLETAYIDGNIASEISYKPGFVSNNHREGKKVISVIESELLKCDKCGIYYFGRCNTASSDVERA